MKIKNLAMATGIAVLAMGPAAAEADVIAGWDFSQYEVPGSTAGGGTTPFATNSSLDPNGAGAGAANVGVATITGLLPSAGAGFNGTEDGIASAPRGPIESNLADPFAFGEASFEAFSILRDEVPGTVTHHYALAGTGGASADFAASAAFSGGGADTWSVSFGGKMLNGNGTGGGEISCGGSCTRDIEVSLSTNGGSSFGAAQTVSLTTTDTRFTVGGFANEAATTTPVVRLSFGSGSGTALIDNVAIEAVPLPEPGASVGLLAGLAGLLGLRRVRR